MSINLAIVLLNYKSAEETISLYKIVKQWDFNSRVFVIDNDSGKSDVDNLKANISITDLMLLTKNTGYSGGNNVGIQEAIMLEIPYMLLLNPDIRLEADCIKKLIQTIEGDAKLAAVGPRICFRESPDLIYSDGGMVDKQKGFYSYHLNSREKIKNVIAESNLQSVDYVNGSVFLGRTAVFKEIGLLREDFFLYFEETEWCLRAKAHGYKFATNTDALALHLASNKGAIYHYYMTRNRLLLAKLYPDFYKTTKKVVRGKILKKIKRSIKSLKIPDSKVRAQLKGYISGRIKSKSL